jgi:hypothetical protein
VSLIHTILALYLGLYDEPLTIRNVAVLTDDDKLITRAVYHTGKLTVFTGAGQAFESYSLRQRRYCYTFCGGH